MNETNIIPESDSPTNEPTNEPSKDPTESPITSIPSSSPTTAAPSETPSESPTMEPTTPDPTGVPSMTPSKVPTSPPTTAHPTAPYTQSPTPAPTPAPTRELNRSEQIAEDIQGASLIQITIAVLVVIYICIGGYVWCHERNKRLKILGGMGRKSRAQRLAAARARNQSNRVAMQSMSRNQAMMNNGHAPLAQSSPASMNARSQIRPNQNQQLLMSEGNPDFRV